MRQSVGSSLIALSVAMSSPRFAPSDSLRQLCVGNAEFAKFALDFLFDMLNDESDEVRLNSVDTLGVIAESHQYTTLDLDQLNVVLTLTLDSDQACRRSVFKFLAKIRIAGPTSMLTFVDIMSISLRRYPADAEAIYQCMAQVGENHSALVCEFRCLRLKYWSH